MEFSRQEYWRGLPFPTPGDLPSPRIEPSSLASPTLAGVPGEPLSQINGSCECEGFFWALHCVPLICVSGFMPILYCFDGYGTSSFVLLFQNSFDYSGSSCFHTNFRMICFCSMKNTFRTLIEIALYLQIFLGNIVILTVLILAKHEHGMVYLSICFNHFQLLLSISYTSQSTNLSPPWLNLFLGILFFLMQL